MRSFIFVIALSVLLSSCSPEGKSFVEFDDISDVEAFVDRAVTDGDGDSFFQALDTSNVPEASIDAIEATIGDVFKSIQTAEKIAPQIMTFAEFAEYKNESRKEMPKWIRDNMRPLLWNYQPTKIILYKFGKEGNFSISAGIVERNGKFILVCGYFERSSAATTQ